MTAFVIFIRNRVTDPPEMEAYAVKAKLARGDHRIAPLAFYGAVEVLEGPAADGAVILAFDDMAAAHAWYYSPAYQEARKHRLRGADYRVILTDGVP